MRTSPAEALTALSASAAAWSCPPRGGFIGVEAAENLRERGLDVTLVELADQVLPPLDAEMAAPLAAKLHEHDVRAELGIQVIKVLFYPRDGRILGAQAVGTDGVDKHIDVIATAMAGGLTASELADPELAHAPPYGSGKDPVNMAGMIAENLATGTARTVQWHDPDAALADGAVLIDVRTAAEHARGAIPGALNLPVDELRARQGEIPAGRPLIVHCQVGLRGHTAARLLTQLTGRPTANLDVGNATWAAAHTTEPATPAPLAA
jgi:rhodanese-related sulfurtransferase